jgi:amino acid adenylation domain-containing protein
VEGTKWDLTVSLEERPNGIAGYWEYDSDLFDRTTVTRLAGQFRELLAAAVADPDRRLSEIPSLSAPERHQLLREWNAGADRPLPAPTLHQWFEQEAPRWQENVAVVWDEGSLTYRELSDRAGRLAHHLRKLGVGPDVPVGISLDRGPDQVLAILAVLKAGGAYVPIDPHYPQERQAYVLEDSSARVVITSSSLDDRLPRLSGPTGLEAFGDRKPDWLVLEEMDLDSGPVLAPDAGGAGPDNLAYLMYTSGSTGRPKGVMVTHRNAVRLFVTGHEHLEFRPDDAWTLFHSFAFDMSVWEMWGALLFGGRVVMVPHLISRSPEEFHALLRRHGVTVLNQTPQAFRQLLLVEREQPPLTALRYVILAAETLEVASLVPLWDRYGDQKPLAINMHGITETAVYDTYRPVGIPDLANNSSPIGRALPDLTLRVLDRWQRPVAIGVPGEMYIGGPALARGYLSRPDLTAEKFVPDGFGAVPGERLYRSGDLVRYRPDGDIDFLGRIDHQVKIRGVRVELGEIEAVLGNHPALSQAVAIPRPEPGGSYRLVAFVVPEAGQTEVDPAELRDHARRHLPEPMVPSAFVVVDALPVSPNGKVDRRALAARPVEAQAAATAYKPPGDEMENLIAGIWQEVLQVERVGVDDNFFDLGGHSLALVQVQRKIKERLSRDVPVVDLFRTPTVALLARMLAGPAAASAEEQAAEAARLGDERARLRRARRSRVRTYEEENDLDAIEDEETEVVTR